MGRYCGYIPTTASVAAVDEWTDPAEEQPYHRHTALQWPDPERGPWAATVHWREIAGRIECVGLNIWHGTTVGGDLMPDREPMPITATALREAGIHGLLDAARAKFLREREELLASLGFAGPTATMDLRRGIGAAQREQVKRARVGRRLGRPIYSAEHWNKVAETYLERFRIGSPSPTADVAAHFNVSESTAAKWIARCRRPPLNLLPSTTQGKAKAKEGQ